MTPIDIAHPPGTSAFAIWQGVKGPGDGQPVHCHAQAQLTFAASGVVQMHTEAGRWLVPSQLGVWIPAGVAHRLEILSDAELWIAHWPAEVVAAWAPPTLAGRAFALRVTPMLRALLDAAVVPDVSVEKSALIRRLMLHELTDIADAPTYLPWPTSAAGRRVAELALADRRQHRKLAALAAEAAVSERSLSRLFPAETGLTFKSWRQRARIVQTLDRLGHGDPIAKVAVDAGFASTAAFSAAFRQVTATTPTAFMRGPAAVA